jgi:iron complex transport system ATP-binding protein
MTSTEHNPIILKASNLSVGYLNRNTRNILLENLNLSVESGQLICFMGSNGVGKSTLLRTLAGLQKPLQGIITVGGADTLNPKNISVVLTDRITAVNMTVHELVTYGRYPYVDWNIRLTLNDKQIIEQAIELTRISSLVARRLYELSDGQMQMAMIARALAQDTPLLLLDEPTAHLDLNNRVEIMNLLRSLAHTTGKGIMLATHELDLALQTADYIWLAGKNKNILTGIPEDLVLNGAFDEIFQLKGFDLKTGKVNHEAWRKVDINLKGEGHEYLWTKNALERNGFLVSDAGQVTVTIERSDSHLLWTSGDQSYRTLRDLLNSL